MKWLRLPPLSCNAMCQSYSDFSPPLRPMRDWPIRWCSWTGRRRRRARRDQTLAEMASAVLQVTANTYPEVDFINLEIPENRLWVEQYEEAWKALDAKYGLGKICSLAE